MKNSLFVSFDDKKNEKLDAKIYMCLLCDQKFLDFRQLGGHFKNTHPGKKQPFSKRTETRFKRTLERQAYQLAK